MSNKKDEHGNRMKAYERVIHPDGTLPHKTPVIIRVDGRSFSKLTRRHFKLRPIDPNFTMIMDFTARTMLDNIDGAVLCYVQSDEISFLLHDYCNENSQPWFGNKLQKLVSVSASMATMNFLYKSHLNLGDRLTEVMFDSRAFSLPREEVFSYFWWRQKDWIRNSIQMHARHFFSHKELYKLNSKEIKRKMKYEKSFDWDGASPELKYGRLFFRNEPFMVRAESKKNILPGPVPKLVSEEGKIYWKRWVENLY